MRVTCEDVYDFLENLNNAVSVHFAETGIYRKTIYVDKTKLPIDKDKRNSVKYDVYFQASTIVDLEDGGQYLLEMKEYCGIDYHDATREFIGTSKANELRSKIDEFCEKFSLIVMPGTVDF